MFTSIKLFIIHSSPLTSVGSIVMSLFSCHIVYLFLTTFISLFKQQASGLFSGFFLLTTSFLFPEITACLKK